MASHGETYRSIIVKHQWLAKTWASFYGVFGYMTETTFPAVYVIALISFGALVVVTATTLRSRWSMMPHATRLCMALAPVIFLINLFISLHHSLYYDFQAQGRYLFPSLVPFALMIRGAVHYESLRSTQIRRVAELILTVSCSLTLTHALVLNPVLRP
jgi:hypothetical protein